MPRIPARQFNQIQLSRSRIEEFLPLIQRYSISRGGSTGGEEPSPLDEFLSRLMEKEEKRRKRQELLTSYIRAGVDPSQIPIHIRLGISSEKARLYEKAGIDLENPSPMVRGLMDLE